MAVCVRSDSTVGEQGVDGMYDTAIPPSTKAWYRREDPQYKTVTG